MQKGFLIISQDTSDKLPFVQEIARDKKTATLDGNTWKTDHLFFFNDVEDETELIIIDNFPVSELGALYNFIPGPIKINKKYKRPYQIKPSFIVICSCRIEDVTLDPALFRRWNIMTATALAMVDEPDTLPYHEGFRIWANTFFSDTSGNVNRLIPKADVFFSFTRANSDQVITMHYFMKCLNIWAGRAGRKLNPASLLNAQGRIVRRPGAGILPIEYLYMQTPDAPIKAEF